MSKIGSIDVKSLEGPRKETRSGGSHARGIDDVEICERLGKTFSESSSHRESLVDSEMCQKP